MIHIHGSFGNFYQNEFVRTMAKTYSSAGLAYLSFNLAGHDALTEGYRNEWDFEYAGGAVTMFDQCLDDITAAVKFVHGFCDRIVLQGHSIGCDRILHFLITTKVDYEFVLLSPCDSYRLQANWIAPESVEEQISRLQAAARATTEFDWLPNHEYGIRQRDWSYPIPITRRSLLSVMNGPPFRLMRLDQPCSFHPPNAV